MARFEVLGLDADRDLIRSLAREWRRKLVASSVLCADRRWFGANLDLKRQATTGRRIDL
jgi:hypothetical protein